MKFTLAVAVAVVATTSSTQAAIDTVATQSEFGAAINGRGVIVEEIFPAAIPSARTITFSTGVTSEATGSGFSTSFGDNSVLFPDTGPSDGFGEFFTGIGASGVSPTTIVFTFPEPVFGFFAPFESATGIDVSVVGDATLFDVSELGSATSGSNQPFDGTFGVVTTGPTETFTQLVFSVDPAFGSSFETFGVDSFQFGVVPEPASAALLFSGLVALSVRRRRA
ncbi:MAG: PEP-CTERM sorting domain-containing protein [Planctomycetota bacterium]